MSPSKRATHGAVRSDTFAGMDPSDRERLRAQLRPHAPVHWLHPAQLVRVGAQVAAARTVGEFVARRENEAGLPAEFYDLSASDSDFWIDYAADVGDGFDPTYAIARSIAADTVPAQPDRPGTPAAPPHGDLLVLGGDETYPVASQTNYAERTTSVYRAALPERGDTSPALFAVPGNHDWYDGLTSFLRIFCQGWLSDVPFPGCQSASARWVDPVSRTADFVGGWRTLQSRSYFAARLPHNWWLWGTDIQFDGYIDAPQLAYFVEAATHLGADENLILCTGKPSWVGVGEREIPTLEDFVARTLGERADAVRLVCSGDRHHYSRYVPTGASGPAALVTCGGGGAYLSPTHVLPETVGFGRWSGDGDPDRIDGFRRVDAFPSPAESRRLSGRFWRLPFRNPMLGVMLGTVYAVLVWLLAGTQPGDTALARLAGYSLGETRFAPGSLPALVGCLAVLGATVALARPAGVLRPRTAVGLAHGLVQLLLCLAITYAVPDIEGHPLPVSVLITLGVGVVGGALSALLLATYFYLCQLRTDMHANELFAGLRIVDFKSYLRIRVGPDGATVYPLGLRSVPHRWLAGDAGPLLDAEHAVVPEAIDEPFTVAPRTTGAGTT